MIACAKPPEISQKIEAMVQIPHPLEDSDNQIPSSPVRQRCQMPGYAPMGGRRGGNWSFDLTDTLHLHKMVEKHQKTSPRLKIFKGFLKLANADINISCLLNGQKHRIEEKHNK